MLIKAEFRLLDELTNAILRFEETLTRLVFSVPDVAVICEFKALDTLTKAVFKLLDELSKAEFRFDETLTRLVFSVPEVAVT